MTITIAGGKGEFFFNIVTDGKEASVTKWDNGCLESFAGKCSVQIGDGPGAKTKIVETTEKYDKDGKIVEKITREEISEDCKPFATNAPVFVPYCDKSKFTW